MESDFSRRTPCDFLLRLSTSESGRGSNAIPPYVKAKSKAQQRKFFELAKQGKMSMADAKGKSQKGSKYDKLPSRKKKK